MTSNDKRTRRLFTPEFKAQAVKRVLAGQELGLRHLEGRGWRGFHHHATLCIAAYGYWSPIA
jgi:SRSO17 transposase